MLMTDEGWCEKNRNMFRKLLNRDLIKNCECNDPDQLLQNLGCSYLLFILLKVTLS